MKISLKKMMGAKESVVEDTNEPCAVEWGLPRDHEDLAGQECGSVLV